MKKTPLILLFIFYFSSYQAQVNPNLVNIPHEVFVNNGQNDFNKILSQDASIREKVEILHSLNEINHDLTVQTNSFNEYWKRYELQWFHISLVKNQKPLLLFKGLKNDVDERDYIEIYDIEKERSKRGLFSNVGVLLAYNIHPLTKEIILYVHKYPCCKSASHNIYRLRRIKDGLKINDRFFVGRDSGDMVGPFFPEKIKFSDRYYRLEKKTEVRWSPAVVNENAFENWATTNLMIHYNEGAIYKVLYEKNGWQFVVFFNGIVEEQSRMLNYTNFNNKGVYGWIEMMKPD